MRLKLRWECPEIGVCCGCKIDVCIVIARNKAERRCSRGIPIHCISLCIVGANGETGRLTTTFFKFVPRNVESLDEWSYIVDIYFANVGPCCRIMRLGNRGKNGCRQPLGTNTIHRPHIRDRSLLDHWIFIQNLVLLLIVIVRIL